MADGERTSPSLTAKVVAVIAIVIVAWLVLRLSFATVRLAFAIAGYILVAFVAYQFGKWVGRHSGPDDDDDPTA